MLPLSNYYNIGSESYFLNIPLFNYKVIFKYSYFIIPSILLWSLCQTLCYLTGNVSWRFPFISKPAFFWKTQYIQLPFLSSFSRQKWMVWLLQPCNQASLSLLCFLQALLSRAQQKPPREQQHSGLHNVLLLPPQLHKFPFLTKSFLPWFLFIFPLFFCAAYSFIFISCFNLLSPSSMLYVPSKGAVHTQQSLQFLKSNGTCSGGCILQASKCPGFT